jgi:hypothetical protein
MAGIGWQAELDLASNEDEIAAVCNEFLNTWTADELSELPSSCRLADGIDGEAIGPYAIRLIAALGTGDRASAPMLHKMATFFTKAALRLVDVMEAAARASPHALASNSGSNA